MAFQYTIELLSEKEEKFIDHLLSLWAEQAARELALQRGYDKDKDKRNQLIRMVRSRINESTRAS